MDRRSFAVGLATLAASPAAAADFRGVFDRLIEPGRLAGIVEALTGAAARVYSAHDAGFTLNEWACFDDNGVFDKLFGDGLDDGMLLILVRLIDLDTPCRSTNNVAKFALPVGFVAYQALVRGAYLAAAGSDYDGAYVAFTKADTTSSLKAKLKSARQAWTRYIETYGPGAVDRL